MSNYQIRTTTGLICDFKDCYLNTEDTPGALLICSSREENEDDILGMFSLTTLVSCILVDKPQIDEDISDDELDAVKDLFAK